jgi:hypothetical protein
MSFEPGDHQHPRRLVDSRNGEEDDEGEEKVGNEHVNSEHFQAIQRKRDSSAIILSERYKAQEMGTRTRGNRRNRRTIGQRDKRPLRFAG